MHKGTLGRAGPVVKRAEAGRGSPVVVPSLLVSEVVKLCHCHTLEAAHEARALLEAEGISVRIDGERGSTIFGGSDAMLDLRVWVPEAQLEQALRIIGEHDESEPDDAEGDDEENERDDEESSDDDDDDKQPDEEMPPRYPSWMRSAKKVTGPGLALAALVDLARGGDAVSAAFLLMIAVLVFGITQSSDEDESPESK